MKIEQSIVCCYIFFAVMMLDGVYLILVFASNDEAVNTLAAEITEISAANKLKFSNFRSQ